MGIGPDPRVDGLQTGEPAMGVPGVKVDSKDIQGSKFAIGPKVDDATLNGGASKVGGEIIQKRPRKRERERVHLGHARDGKRYAYVYWGGG